jgi:hypothetical protein
MPSSRGRQFSLAPTRQKVAVFVEPHHSGRAAEAPPSFVASAPQAGPSFPTNDSPNECRF